MTPFSALQLKSHYFPLVNIRANVGGAATGKILFDQNIVAVPEPGKQNQWHLEIFFTQKSTDASAPFLYDVELQVVGLFELIADFPGGDKETLVRVNGLGILYGAAREMVLNITARSLHGPLSLPVVNFVEVLKQGNVQAPAAAAPTSEHVPQSGGMPG
ncbi:MAG TPA: protein-export chaperone SecB [Verrucomicrobiae bacterium]|jgi:preprotein translocase subunit SecB|nr:protein-export chaperone SecB [Verrucomicrobiae bacterium]